MQKIVKAICRKEGIACRTIEVLKGGQINAVFRVDEQYVLRIGVRADAGPRLEHETRLIQRLVGQIPVANVLAFGEEQGFFYQLQQCMPGQKLYTVWKDFRGDTQDSIAEELAACLKTLHSIHFSDFGEGRQDSQPYASWTDFLTEKFQATVAELRERNIRMLPGFLEVAVEYFEEHRQVLQNGVPALVHSDLNLGNILVADGKISAILDFEFALQAPADYELQAIEAFCLYPNDWAEEENAVYCTADFANLIPLLRKHDPELFVIPSLRQRLNIYHVFSALSSYLEWRRANLGTIPPERMAAKAFYMGRVWNILYDAGARMFF